MRICTLIRDRGWVIPLYLQHLEEINYPKELITIHWVVNNSTDNSLELIQKFKEKNNSKYKKIIIEEINKSNLVSDRRDKLTRINKGIYSHLADMRNYMFDSLKEDFLFNIDSDILVESDTLIKLVKADKDMVSAWIYNGYEFSEIKSQYKYWDFTNLCMQRKVVIGDMERIGHINLKKIDIRRNLRDGVTLLPVDLGGAVCLYRQNLVNDKSVRFFDHVDGEDTPYCILAKDNGYGIFGELTCYCQHIMNPRWLKKYENGEKIS